LTFAYEFAASGVANVKSAPLVPFDLGARGALSHRFCAVRDARLIVSSGRSHGTHAGRVNQVPQVAPAKRTVNGVGWSRKRGTRLDRDEKAYAAALSRSTLASAHARGYPAVIVCESTRGG